MISRFKYKVKNALSRLRLKSMKCFLDLDGVLGNLVKGLCEYHRQPLPTGNYDYDFYEEWGMSFTQAFKVNDLFWSNLEKTPWCDPLINKTIEVFGIDNISFLSKPIKYTFGWEGKTEWVTKLSPVFAKKVICCLEKAELAHPGVLLIDDNDYNIDSFTAAGGHGILVPAPYNKNSDKIHCIEEFLLESLDNFKMTHGLWER